MQLLLHTCHVANAGKQAASPFAGTRNAVFLRVYQRKKIAFWAEGGLWRARAEPLVHCCGTQRVRELSGGFALAVFVVFAPVKTMVD